MVFTYPFQQAAARVTEAYASQNQRIVDAVQNRFEEPLVLAMLDALRKEQQMVEKVNWRPYNFFHAVMKLAGVSQGQLFQDLWALWELDFKKGGYFVEFGGLDGKELSNTYLLEKEFGWTGIVAEPNPVHWEALQKNRSCYLSPHCVTEHTGGSAPFLVSAQSEYSRMESVVPMDQHETTGLRENADRIMVPTISLNDLLEQAGAPENPDFLSIDTEGSEFLILNSIDLNRWRFRLIAVEHNFTEAQQQIDRLLKSKGYVRKFKEMSAFDGWYVRQGGNP